MSNVGIEKPGCCSGARPANPDISHVSGYTRREHGRIAFIRTDNAVVLRYICRTLTRAGEKREMQMPGD